MILGNVYVNCPTPGGDFSGQYDTFCNVTARMAERGEMRGTLVFLALRASSHVTGQNLVVDLTVW